MSKINPKYHTPLIITIKLLLIGIILILSIISIVRWVPDDPIGAQLIGAAVGTVAAGSIIVVILTTINIK